MSLHNTLRTDAVCPRCGKCGGMEFEIFFGDTRGMKVILVGDQYPWVPLKAVQNGGRPDGGDLDGEGYAVCPSCGLDFFVRVLVRGDVIIGIVPDPEKPGYLPEPAPDGEPKEPPGDVPDAGQGNCPG
jgi:hypothetical protein